MTTMFFTSVDGVKTVKFDSSPGRAIAKRLGDGQWDEKSYKATLIEDMADEKTFSVQLRRKPPEGSNEIQKLQKVGTLRWVRPNY